MDRIAFDRGLGEMARRYATIFGGGIPCLNKNTVW